MSKSFFGSWKFLGKNILLVQKNLGSKKCWVKSFFGGSKFIFGVIRVNMEGGIDWAWACLIIMHLHNVWRQFSIIFENMLTRFFGDFFFASCSNVCYVMYEYKDLLTQHFKHVWRRIHTMLADMLTQNWWHLLQICEVIFITICSKWCKLLKARQTNILKMFG